MCVLVGQHGYLFAASKYEYQILLPPHLTITLKKNQTQQHFRTYLNMPA